MTVIVDQEEFEEILLIDEGCKLKFECRDFEGTIKVG